MWNSTGDRSNFQLAITLSFHVGILQFYAFRGALCSDPKEYRYCGYAEALAKCSALAQEGIRVILGLPQTACCEELSTEYRKHLFLRGAAATENNPLAFDLAKAQEVVEQENGELLPQLRLRCRIRYSSDGVILGVRGCDSRHLSHEERLALSLGHPHKSDLSPVLEDWTRRCLQI